MENLAINIQAFCSTSHPVHVTCICYKTVIKYIKTNHENYLKKGTTLYATTLKCTYQCLIKV